MLAILHSVGSTGQVSLFLNLIVSVGTVLAFKGDECESSNEERLAMNKYLKYGDNRINFIVTG
jgi:hypothetical protein